MASLGQPSTQLPQRMHSPSSISSRWTMALTSRLMGQLRVQVWQLEQLRASATSRSEGHLTRLRIDRPMIMKGAIQQMVWQPARRPKIRASPRNRGMMI